MEQTRSPKPELELTKGAREQALNQARRRLVLDGAWRVFAREGLDNATMRAIATEAGCTTGAIYPLFPSKEAVYAALLAESLLRLHAHVEGSLCGVRDARARLEAAARAFLSYYRDRPDEVALGLYLWHGIRPRGLDPDLNADLNRSLNATLALLREAIRALGCVEERAVRVEVSALFAFLIGSLVVHQTGRLRVLGAELDAIAAGHLQALADRLEGGRARKGEKL